MSRLAGQSTPVSRGGREGDSQPANLPQPPRRRPLGREALIVLNEKKSEEKAGGEEDKVNISTDDIKWIGDVDWLRGWGSWRQKHQHHQRLLQRLQKKKGLTETPAWSSACLPARLFAASPSSAQRQSRCRKNDDDDEAEDTSLRRLQSAESVLMTAYLAGARCPRREWRVICFSTRSTSGPLHQEESPRKKEENHPNESGAEDFGVPTID